MPPVDDLSLAIAWPLRVQALEHHTMLNQALCTWLCLCCSVMRSLQVVLIHRRCTFSVICRRVYLHMYDVRDVQIDRSHILHVCLGLAHACPMKLGLEQASPLLRCHERVSTPCPSLYKAMGIKLVSQCLCTSWTNSQVCPTVLNCLPTASNSSVSDEWNDPRVQCNVAQQTTNGTTINKQCWSHTETYIGFFHIWQKDEELWTKDEANWTQNHTTHEECQMHILSGWTSFAVCVRC